MNTSATTSEYPILDYPPIMPLVVDKPRIWKFNNIEVAPNCPRCASSNTKFCYYNNYSFSQPRYFCKGCKRYWTKGGSLRKVPVGGGCRKSRPSREKQGGGSNNPAPILSPENNEKSCSRGAATCNLSENVMVSSLGLGGQMEGVGMMMDYQNQGGLINGVYDDLVLPQVHPQDFVYPNSNELELRGVIGEPEEDILWSNSTTLPNFESQQSMEQVGDFGLFSPDNELSGNLMGDDWGLFDLSAYDFF